MNRLNAAESRIWDRCFIYFVRTGEWPMGMTADNKIDMEGDELGNQNIDEPNKMVIDADLIKMDSNATPFLEPIGIGNLRKPISKEEVKVLIEKPDYCEPLNSNESLELTKKGLMADPSGRGRYPGSRDWDMECLLIECLRTTCVANYNKKCSMPSRIEIGLTGKCKGYQDPNSNTNGGAG